MSPTIRIDDDVYGWLQMNAKPFEDTPNTVLRRIADLDEVPRAARKPQAKRATPSKVNRSGLSGRTLKEEWNVPVRHALYHRDGHWYNNLKRFPAALFDPDGYVIFKSEEEYLNCPLLQIGVETSVAGGKTIKSIPGYVKVR